VKLSFHIGLQICTLRRNTLYSKWQWILSIAIIFTRFLLSKTKSIFRFCKGRVVRKIYGQFLNCPYCKSTDSDVVLTFYDFIFLDYSLFIIHYSLEQLPAVLQFPFPKTFSPALCNRTFYLQYPQRS